MVRNVAMWERFEAEFVRSQPADFRRSLAIVEALAREAEALGVFRRTDPLEGLEAIIGIARAVNRV